MRDAFLRAILQRPDDDARLVFADWLEENGDESERRYAEFVRLQCRLAAGAGRPEDERDERRLLALHSANWGAPLKALLGLPVEATPWEYRPPNMYGEQAPHWEFRRGFIEKLSLSAEDLLRHARELFQLAPLRHLRVTERVGRPAKFFALPQLAHLTQLELPNAELTPAGARRLASSSHLANLTALTINAPTIVGSNWSEIGPEGACALAGSPNLTRLTCLHLPGNRIGWEGVDALVRSPWRLASLNLSRNGPGDDWVTTLTGTDFLSSVLRLNLSGNDLSPESIAVLADCPYLSNLTTLDLEENRFGPEGARALARSAHLLNLRSLNLEFTNLADEGLLELVAGRGLGGLTDLTIGDSGSGVTAEGLAALLASHLRLRRLNCGCCEFGDMAGEFLAASPMLASLRDLDFKGNEWTERGVRALVAAPGLALTHLDLSLNSIGDEGAVALASCPGLAGLRSLRLGSSDYEDEIRIGDAVARALAAGPWVGLEELDLSYHAIGDEGAFALAQSDVLAGLHRLDMSSPMALYGEEGRTALRARFGNRVRL
jgi:uncharacterized protein (TIGR02996 family)